MQSNNKKLYLIDDKCDTSFAKHTHGGHECGSDGKWDLTKCVPTYCDLGYIFDHLKNK